MILQPPRKGVVVVSGILFWYPLAGVTFQFLHYMLGLRRLGYDVYYIEDCGHPIYDPVLNDLSPDVTRNLDTVVPVLEAYGFAGKWGFRGRYEGGDCFGLTHDQMKQIYRECDAFLNVTGAQDMGDDQLFCRRRIYVESDPFPLQVRIAEKDPLAMHVVASHDTFFTFGENIGAADCRIPPGPVKWMPTRQPVALDLWMGPETGGGTYNTITTWQNSGKHIEYQGETFYWTKDREFEKFLNLPKLCRARFELAATIDSPVRERVEGMGWRVVDSISVSRDFDAYRNYIQTARGEFTVARDQYVRPRTGWFSDRTACYLAAGRPVITQETGFSQYLPAGRGLFGFETMEDILSAVESIESNYSSHCKAASEIAREYFDAETVLRSLMERAGL